MHPSVVIEFMDPHGNVQANPPGTPVVKVQIGPVKKSDHSYPTGENQAITYALIDTGCDCMAIDADLAVELKMHETGRRDVRGVNHTENSAVHPGFICFAGTQKVYLTDFVATPMVKNGRKYTVIIGMEMLNKGVLTMDFHRHDYRFSLEDCVN
ncbi:hypothetical protein QIY50_24800 [Pseudomonas putida]|nr:hypothetical protein QIY50_24800 [Pseudomonas putida]